jgi:hypothetical protein
MPKQTAVRSIAFSLALLAGLATTSLASADDRSAGMEATSHSSAMSGRSMRLLRVTSAATPRSSGHQAYRLPPHGGWHGANSNVGTSHAPASSGR